MKRNQIQEIIVVAVIFLAAGCGPAGNDATLSPVGTGGETMLAIAAGGLSTCVLTSQGGVKCWGDNGTGKLGDGTMEDSTLPVEVRGLSAEAKEISVGSSHTCALLSTGDIECWGRNVEGQLGNPATNFSSYPMKVEGLPGKATAVAAGNDHTCAILSSGDVVCWGENDFGELGDGTTKNSGIPVDVKGLPEKATAIAAGGAHTCALLASGKVMCWGYDIEISQGDRSAMIGLVPEEVSGLSNGITAIALGGSHACAVSSSGGLQCWGRNGYGELGIGRKGDRSSPVDVKGLSQNAKSVTAGENSTCAILSDGGVKCWGNNGDGQLGNGTREDSPIPVDVAGLSGNATAVAAGRNHICALTSDQRVKCWGSGYLGDGMTDGSLVPVDAAIGPHASQIAAARSLWTSSPTRTITQSPTRTATRLPTRTSTPTVTFTPTYHPWPTPTWGLPPTITRGPKQTCPPPTNAPVDMPFAEDPLEYGPWILAYIRAQGNAEGLPALLDGLSVRMFEQDFHDTSAVYREDVTGDLTDEIIVSLFQAEQGHLSGFGEPFKAMTVFIVGCRDDQYRMLYQSTVGSALRGFFAASGIAAIRDINADGIREIVYSYEADEAMHGNEFFVSDILGWDGATFRKLLLPPPESSPASGMYIAGPSLVSGISINSIPEFHDIDGNGTLEILFPDRSIPRLCDEGPMRISKDIFMWDGANYRYMWTDPGSPEYRFQAAFDGDYFTLAGLYDKAETSYLRAIHDRDLPAFDVVEWSKKALNQCCYCGYSDPDEPYRIEAYARLRLLELYAFLGREDDAKTVWEYVRTHFSEETAGYAYAALAKVFWDSYSVDRDIQAACVLVRDQSEVDRDKVFGEMGFYGSSSTYPNAQTICPFSSAGK
jgi:alpha-tubulin suppressor-like RCC1 family protein